MHYHYPIDLPPLEELIDLERVLERGRRRQDGFWDIRGYTGPRIAEIGWPIQWVYYFGKQDRTGTIHSDLKQEVRSLDHPQAYWAINFIAQGQGFMEFWAPEDLEALIPEARTQWYHDTSCLTSKPPREHHLQIPGQAYLLNAGTAHRAGCQGLREAISLRPPQHLFDRPWQAVLESFGIQI